MHNVVAISLLQFNGCNKAVGADCLTQCLYWFPPEKLVNLEVIEKNVETQLSGMEMMTTTERGQREDESQVQRYCTMFEELVHPILHNFIKFR